MKDRTYKTYGGYVPGTSHLAINNWLVLGAMPAADRKALLFGFERHAIVKHRNKIPQPSRRPGSGIEGINDGPTLPYGHQNSCAFKFFKLPLNRIERNPEIAGNRPAIGLTMMKQVEQHSFRRATSKHLRQSRGIHDRNIGSYDRNVKSVNQP